MQANVSTNRLFIHDSPDTVAKCIAKAKDEAINFMSKSGFIVEKHNLGCSNSSYVSTVDGALSSARILSEGIGQKDSTANKFSFFGERISQAIKTFKAFKSSR